MAVSLLPGKVAVAGNGAPHPTHFAWSLYAPRRVCEAEDVRTSGKGWRAWSEHLRDRTRPGKLNKLWKGRTSPLLWGWRQREIGPESAALLLRLHDFARKKGRLAGHVEGELRSWLDGARGAAPHPSLALESIAWTMVLPRLAGTASPALWWAAWEYLVETALDAGEPQEIAPLAAQLYGGELAMALAFQFPELAVSGQLAEQARQTVDEGAKILLDSAGMCAARDLPSIRALVGCWTRAYSLGVGIDRKFWAPTVPKRLHAAMMQMLHWSRRDGCAVLDDDDPARLEPAFMERLTELFGSRRTASVTGSWLPAYRAKLGVDSKSTGKLPDAAVHSEWGQTSLLRSDWTRSAASLALVWNEPAPRIEFSIGHEILALGRWHTELRRDGELLSHPGPWEEVCWISDSDGVYLELEQQLAPGLAMQRQMFLAREDRFLLIADALMGANPSKWEYSSSLPLVPTVTFEPAEETTEGRLNTRQGSYRVFPLALPEWRSASRGCELSQTTHGLTLRQSQTGMGMFAPLWIDLDPRRQTTPCTWRQLTVAEDRQILPRDCAVGFRVQVGKRQWIIYRSLGEHGNRTLLGHNLITDYLVARFERGGVVEALVEIE
jgi:hypothetical protein